VVEEKLLLVIDWPRKAFFSKLISVLIKKADTWLKGRMKPNSLMKILGLHIQLIRKYLHYWFSIRRQNFIKEFFIRKCFSLVTFWQNFQLSYEKYKHNMLMKLTPAVNFINVLWARFKYESLFGSFFYLHVTREKLLKRHLYEKFALKMLMKLTPEVRVQLVMRQNKIA